MSQKNKPETPKETIKEKIEKFKKEANVWDAAVLVKNDIFTAEVVKVSENDVIVRIRTQNLKKNAIKLVTKQHVDAFISLVRNEEFVKKLEAIKEILPSAKVVKVEEL
ncbi:MAG: hypothetical protein QXQ91_02490 [Nanopusillaceae archaeon]